jgi:hypothetical protein
MSRPGCLQLTQQSVRNTNTAALLLYKAATSYSQLVSYHGKFRGQKRKISFVGS